VLKRDSGWQGIRVGMRYMEAERENGGEIDKGDHLRSTGLPIDTLGSTKEIGRTRYVCAGF